MKKLILLLLGLGMITPIFAQLSTQDRDQINMIDAGIDAKQRKIKQLQQSKIHFELMKSEFAELSEGENLTQTQEKRLAELTVYVKKLEILNANLDDQLAEERNELEYIINRRDKLVFNAATSDNMPKEPGYFQGRRLEKGLILEAKSLDIQEKISKVEYDNTVRRLSLERLTQTTNKETGFTLALINYSTVNIREFRVKSEITGETTCYLVNPNETQVHPVLPGKYFCDIVDINNGKTRINNYATIDVTYHYINQVKCSGYFYAPKYF